MLNDPVLPNAAKALLSHLHTPYLKVALIDRRLLEDSGHPARRLLDEMVEAGSLLIDEASPTKGIFPVMQQTVESRPAGIYRRRRTLRGITTELQAGRAGPASPHRHRGAACPGGGTRTREAAVGQGARLAAYRRPNRASPDARSPRELPPHDMGGSVGLHPAAGERRRGLRRLAQRAGDGGGAGRPVRPQRDPGRPPRPLRSHPQIARLPPARDPAHGQLQPHQCRCLGRVAEEPPGVEASGGVAVAQPEPGRPVPSRAKRHLGHHQSGPRPMRAPARRCPGHKKR